jgi:hypothetical protein
MPLKQCPPSLSPTAIHHLAFPLHWEGDEDKEKQKIKNAKKNFSEKKQQELNPGIKN